MIKVSALKKNPGNPRQIHGHKLDLLKKSVTEFDKMMALRPIIVDENNVVLGGNMRLAAIKALGHKEIPDEWVKRADDLTEAEKREFIIKDNAGFGEWDWDVIANEWSDEPLADWGLDVPGFEAVEEVGDADAEPQIDKAAELNKKWKVKSGDLWQIGEHRLLCGDSTKRGDVGRLMGGEKAQMVFTDPPYGMNLNADFSDMDSKFKGSTGGNKYSAVIGDCEDFRPELITAILEYFADCPEMFIWGADYFAEYLVNKNAGSWIVWDKRLDESADKMYGSTFELCWSKAKHKREIARVKWAGIFGMEKEDTKTRQHPTQKPTELAKWFFDKWGDGAYLVADVFGGSGSTMVAAENTNRKAYLCEISENYCAVILERMATAFPDIEIKKLDG